VLCFGSLDAVLGLRCGGGRGLHLLLMLLLLGRKCADLCIYPRGKLVLCLSPEIHSEQLLNFARTQTHERVTSWHSLSSCRLRSVTTSMFENSRASRPATKYKRVDTPHSVFNTFL
jgi:hypothetical protein